MHLGWAFATAVRIHPDRTFRRRLPQRGQTTDTTSRDLDFPPPGSSATEEWIADQFACNCQRLRDGRLRLIIALLVALHSPCALREPGLRMCVSEKSRDGDGLYRRLVRSLQSGLSRKNREIRACFAHFGVISGGSSLQFRLRGGGRSLALTFLRQIPC